MDSRRNWQIRAPRGRARRTKRFLETKRSWRSVLGSSLDFRQEAKQTDRTVRVHPSRPSLLLASPSAAPALKTRNKQPSHDMRTCSACKVICVGQGLKVLPGVAGGGAPASRFRQLSSGLWRRQGPIRGPPPLVRSSPSFLIVNGGTHAERGESGARAGRTPLWGKRSGMVFRMHILPEPYQLVLLSGSTSWVKGEG